MIQTAGVGGGRLIRNIHTQKPYKLPYKSRTPRSEAPKSEQSLRANLVLRHAVDRRGVVALHWDVALRALLPVQGRRSSTAENQHGKFLPSGCWKESAGYVPLERLGDLGFL